MEQNTTYMENIVQITDNSYIEEFAKKDIIKYNKKDEASNYFNKYNKKQDRITWHFNKLLENKTLNREMQYKTKKLKLEHDLLSPLIDIDYDYNSIDDNYKKKITNQIKNKYNIYVDDSTRKKYEEIERKLRFHNKFEYIDKRPLYSYFSDLICYSVTNYIYYIFKCELTMGRCSRGCVIANGINTTDTKEFDIILNNFDNIFTMKCIIINYEKFEKENIIKLYVDISNIVFNKIIKISDETHPEISGLKHTIIDKIIKKKKFIDYSNVFMMRALYCPLDKVNINDVDNHIKIHKTKYTYFGLYCIKEIIILVCLANKFDENSLFYKLSKDTINIITIRIYNEALSELVIEN